MHRRSPPALPVGDVGGLARAAELAVLAVRQQVEFTVLARNLVDVGIAPRVERDALLEVRSPVVSLARTVDT